MPGRTVSSTTYRYGFNGKENDNEVKGAGNQIDFNNRIYDTRLGKWLSVDPLQKKFPGETPYAFVSNNPIIYKDADGRDRILTITLIDKDGKKVQIEGRDKDYFIYKTNICTTCPYNETISKTKFDEHVNITVDLGNPQNSSVKTILENPKSTSILDGKWVDKLNAFASEGDESNYEMEGFRIYGSATNGDDWGPKLPRAAAGTISVDVDRILTLAGNWRSFGPITSAGDAFSHDLVQFMKNPNTKEVFEKLGNLTSSLSAAAEASGEKDPALTSLPEVPVPTAKPGQKKGDSVMCGYCNRFVNNKEKANHTLTPKQEPKN